MKLIRLEQVSDKTGLGRSSVYKYMALGTFPKPVPLGDRAVGWVSDEVDAWVQARINERDAKAAKKGNNLPRPEGE